MHVPVEVVASARRLVCTAGVDLCVAVGGGSAIGLAKAIALDTHLPILCVPTTYSGSEMTPVWGVTEDGAKRTGRDLAVLPRTVIYDPELTLALPAGVSGAGSTSSVSEGSR
jgi:maleylacetate reductase